MPMNRDTTNSFDPNIDVPNAIVRRWIDFDCDCNDELRNHLNLSLICRRRPHAGDANENAEQNSSTIESLVVESIV